ncbi:hypothetical protein DFP72DRAFT_1030950 [Ephemerocybe angulata]|uniref:Uncharacterized protein n=1 Tax=Ephemerocybe angulata TaxID=980116 RepID=A0A8H6IBC9_9AGAR|nr:hypothetical protein DFP72DRAFT_1030950 [Tulosesus angulatus]
MNTQHSPIRRKQPAIPGFRPSPRPKRTPISQMTIRELQDLHNLNAKLLADPKAPSSSYVQRVRAEQAAIESRLLEVDGRTKIKGEGDMEVDEAPEPTTSSTIEAKKKALSQYDAMRVTRDGASTNGAGSTFTMREAIELERQAHLQEKERQERILEKKKRLGMPIKGEILTKEEQGGSHLGVHSDLEDDSEDDDDDDDDPASWFEDDQDDGRKGQDIVEPDYEDISDLIRVDENRLPSFDFYGNNEGD